MRANLSIRLSSALTRWVEEQTRKGGFESASEYMRRLLRDEQKRQARQAVEARLADASDSGDPVPVTAATWQETQRRVEKRIQAVSGKRRLNGKHR